MEINIVVEGSSGYCDQKLILKWITNKRNQQQNK